MRAQDEIDTIHAIEALTDIEVSSKHKAACYSLVPPEGYEYGWARYVFGGYTNNYSPHKDVENLEHLMGRGWYPASTSPHPDIQVSKHGFVLNGDLVLMIRKIAKELPWQEVAALEYDKKRHEIITNGMKKVFGEYPMIEKKEED